MAVIEGGASAQLQEVDSVSLASRVTLYDKSSNRISKKHREALPTTQEALMVAGKNDEIATFIRTDRKGDILIGNYIPELVENFEGAVVNVQKWTQTTTTFAPAQSTASGYVVNNTALTTANAVHILQSQRLFYKFPRVPLQLKSRIRVNVATNSVADLGFGFPSGTTLINANGIAIRCVNGLWTAAITSNGAELIATNINDYLTNLVQLNTANLNAEFYVVDAIMDDDNLIITVQNTQTGIMVGYANLPVPLSALKMFAATALPVYYRLYNTATPPATAPNLTIGELQALSLDMNINLDANQVASNLGLTSGRNPFTGAPLTAKVNSTVPTTITLSNTTAGLTTPDGVFVFAAVAGAETDYLCVAWQVPAGLKFIFESVVIETVNQVVAVATTPTHLEWFLGHNQSAASLATTNKITTMVGSQSFIVGRAAGEIAGRIFDKMDSGEVTESGKFVTLGLKMPTATATATETFRVLYRIKGRFI
jgi:hypothetical protein